MRTLARFLSRGLILLAILATGPGAGPDRRRVAHRHRHRSERRRRAGRDGHRDQPGDQRRLHRDLQRGRQLHVTSLPVGTYVVKAELVALQDRGDEADPGGSASRSFVSTSSWSSAALEETVEVTSESPVLQTEIGDGRRGHLRHDAHVAAAQRPQHRPALAAAAGRRDAEPEHVHRDPQLRRRPART